MQEGLTKAILMAGASCAAIFGAAVSAQTAPAQGAEQTAPAPVARPSDDALGDIVVTARSRGETLNSVPVAVSSVTPATLDRAIATDLTKVAEITPGVIISATRQQGGGSIAIRGISSPANVTGFEQAVSVALDGVQTSNGRIASIGFFDVSQIDIMRGPQALFFGKNSPAGVISVKSNGPTDHFQASIGGAYEFVGREKYVDGIVSGPITDNFGIRVAVRYRDLDGWLHNDARPIANPFYNAATGAPAGAAQLPGAEHDRFGNHEVLGRVTLVYRPADNITETLKVFHSRYRDQGPGTASQNIGPCTGPTPRMYGIADPYGDCKADNHTSNGDVSPEYSKGVPLTDGTGRSFGRTNFTSVSNHISVDLGKVSLSSQTGYNRLTSRAQYGLDHTVFSQLYSGESDHLTEFSQELRFVTDLDGPINFAGGFYYQKTKRNYIADVALNTSNYNPATGRFDSAEILTQQQGRTLSGFGQVMWNIVPQVELAAGIRYTDEEKKDQTTSLYGIGAFNVSAITFPGETRPAYLSGTMPQKNWSPEATLTWHPTPDHTVYIAYKTGFKSGGYQAALVNTGTRIGDLDFGPEKVRGGEIGAKGRFFDRRLRISAAAFAYDFKNLQVNAYDPVRVTFIVGNAGKLVQRGFEMEGSYRATDQLNLRGGFTYAHNRFRNYIGQCYAYAFPTGTTRATAVPPPGCSFATATALTLQQDNDGKQPARAPDWSATAGFDFNVPFNSVKVTLSGDTAYMGKYNASDTFSPYSVQDAFWRFNASVGLATIDDHWSATLVGRNLSNKYYVTYASDRTGGASVPGTYGEQRGSVARGREVLLQLKYNY